MTRYRLYSIIIPAILTLGTAISHPIPAAADTTPSSAAEAPEAPPEAPRPDAAAESDSLLYDTTLDDLVVTARVKLIQNDGAKLTYNVSEDPEAKTNSTLEILRKVPGITVDAEENIKVNGQSSFKIFLNGKEDPMLSGDIKTILKSMPASTIQKIEVISEPGAKYEAEGTGGILNIITETRQSLEGYLANVGLYGNSAALGGYLYGRAKAGKVTASADLSYQNQFITAGNHYTSFTETLNYADPAQYRRTTDGSGLNTGDYLGGSFNLSWEPDTLNLFTVNFSGRRNGFKSDASERMEMTDIADTPVWHLDRIYDTHYSMDGLSAMLSYQRTFGRTDHTLVFSYSYNHSGDSNDSYIHYDDVVNYPDIDYTWSANQRQSDQDSHIFQIDYTNIFSPRHLLEAGGKANLRRASSDYVPLYGQARTELTPDQSARVDMNQYDDIAALYASYTGTYGSWNIRTGLRYEYTHRGIDYRIAPAGYSDFSNHYNDWVPNASVSYSWPTAQNLRAAYQMRISRPGISVLNPYRNTLTPGSVSYGNPDLRSEKSHNISLAYSNYGHALTGSLKATYHFSHNSVTDVIFSTPDLPGVIQTTYANVGRYNNLQFDLSLNWSVTQALNLGLWLNETYTNIKAESGLLKASRAHWSTSLNANADYTFPCRLRLSLYGGYGSPWVDLQSTGTSWYYYSIGLGRSFLRDDRLSVNISLNTLFPTHRSYSWSQESESAYASSTSRYRQWSFGINVSWRFGGLSADVKRTASRIEEESTTSGTNSNKK